MYLFDSLNSINLHLMFSLLNMRFKYFLISLTYWSIVIVVCSSPPPPLGGSEPPRIHPKRNGLYAREGEFPLSPSLSRDTSGFRDRAASGSASQSASPSAALRIYHWHYFLQRFNTSLTYLVAVEDCKRLPSRTWAVSWYGTGREGPNAPGLCLSHQVCL